MPINPVIARSETTWQPRYFNNVSKLCYFFYFGWIATRQKALAMTEIAYEFMVRQSTEYCEGG